MARETSGQVTRPLVWIASVILIVGALYLAQDVLIPIALAVLLSFLLTPLVNRLERWGLPSVPSVILVAAVAFAIMGGIGYFVTNQVLELAGSLPQYKQNIKERIQSVRSSGEPGPLDEAAEMVEEIQKEVEEEVEKQNDQPADDPAPGDETSDADAQPSSIFDRRSRLRDRSPPLGESTEADAADAPVDPQDEPIPVVAYEPPQSTFEIARDYLGSVIGVLGTAGIVVVFVIFILIQRDDLRDRLIRLGGEGRLNLTTQTMDEATERISRYLLMQLLINTTYGIPVGIGLWLIGVPGALLWGLLAILLRFIPYIGPWMAASMPILLSLAVFEGWVWPLAVVGLFVALELFSNNVMEPWLYGSSTGMSPMSVLLAAVFWSWLWGGVGLLLAVPLTACLVVLGRHVPQLEFFSILLGNEPALSPAVHFYQRLLAMDRDEAMELADAYHQEHGLLALYDQMVIPALHLEECDRHEGRLDDDQQNRIRQDVREIMEELGEWEDGLGAGTHRGGEASGMGRRVLCLPARDEADELAARMFAHLLTAEGFEAEALSISSLAGEMVEKVRELDAPLVCVSAMPPSAATHARYLCKRLKPQFPELRIIIGLWNVTGRFERTTARLTGAGADQVVTTFEDALNRIRDSANPAVTDRHHRPSHPLP